MYAYVRGPLISITSHFATIEAGGIGYKIHIPSNMAAKLFESDKEVTLFTSFVVREGFQGLYGFLQEREREFFEILIEISGIGPKLALSVIGSVSLEDLHVILVEGDAVALSKIPGIGKKTAERLLVELKNKLEDFFKQGDHLSSGPKENPVYQDALKALVHLGYKHAAAQKALKRTLDQEKNLSLSELISSALRDSKS